MAYESHHALSLALPSAQKCVSTCVPRSASQQVSTCALGQGAILALITTSAGLYDQRLEETEIMLLYQAVQAANATKRLLALSNSETLPQPAPPPSSPPAAAAPDVRPHL